MFTSLHPPVQLCRGDGRTEVAFPPDQGSPKRPTKMIADSIELELVRLLGSRELQLYLSPKNQTTKGIRQLQFNCFGCNFCGALWSSPFRKTSLHPPVQKCRGDGRTEVAFPPDQGSPKRPTKMTADAFELELARPLGIGSFSCICFQNLRLPKGLGNSNSIASAVIFVALFGQLPKGRQALSPSSMS